MNETLVILAAVGFSITIFPVHLYNYLYINTEEKYASYNIGAYRLINFFNANTVKNKPNEMQINGKNKQIDYRQLKKSIFKIYNSIYIFKIVQLGDYGAKNEANIYAMLIQNAFSDAVYKIMSVGGNYTKLRNYSILNEEHGCVRYYAKIVTIVNLIVVCKIFLIIILEKINEHKKQKQKTK